MIFREKRLGFISPPLRIPSRGVHSKVTVGMPFLLRCNSTREPRSVAPCKVDQWFSDARLLLQKVLSVIIYSSIAFRQELYPRRQLSISQLQNDGIYRSHLSYSHEMLNLYAISLTIFFICTTTSIQQSDFLQKNIYVHLCFIQISFSFTFPTKQESSKRMFRYYKVKRIKCDTKGTLR